MNETPKYLDKLPDDFDFGGWETERDKARFDLSLTVEQRLSSLENMIEFTREVHGTIHGLLRNS